MGSEMDTTSLSDTGRRLERARHAERFRTATAPARRLLEKYSTIDWNAPQEFPTFRTHNRLLLDAARKNKVIKREVYNGYRTFTQNGAVIGGFHQLTTSLTSDLAKSAMASRPLVKAHLEAMGLPTPVGRTFAPEETEAGARFFRGLSGPVTVTPSVGPRGGGVSEGIEEESALYPAWEFAQTEHKLKTAHSPGIHLEQREPGLDIRVYVVGETVISALAQLPLFIVGDGSSTVGVLAGAAVDGRSRNSYLAQTPPDVSAESLSELGLDAGEVLAAGDIHDISGTSDPAAGGMTLDVTAKLGRSLRQLAVDALWALPGLRAGGVDLRVADLTHGAEAVVTDINDAADMALHRYPAFGSWHAPAAHIINQMLIASKV
ncbi:hypothetical protein [Nesterenkonia lutea]|uniref:Cyanophycin synthetase n=1 Tax=Nesterenkonia lutea TaxID=272919 RepID=A0ABR9JCQ3_9MICC|nr:hypothetical protein [Nesterenkonia lutea]MBE1523712.1 cyanophycin synthetase [Nesterenkonia lutea]